MICPKCGNQINDDAKYCRYCGEPVRAKRGSAAKILIPLLAVVLLAGISMSVMLLRSLRSPSVADTPPDAAAPSGTEALSGGEGEAAGADENGSGDASGASADESVPEEPVSEGISEVSYIVRPSFGRSPVGGMLNEAMVSLTPSVPAYTVDPGLGNIMNLSDYYLSDAENSKLAENGFFVREGGGGAEFFEIYESNRYYKIPNFVTVDSMMHTYHLYFAHLLKQAERDHMASDLASLSEAMFNKSCIFYETLKGTEWESAAARNAAFFAVGTSLLGASPDIPSEIAGVVSEELGLITAAAGMSISPVTGVNEDYTQYIPRGYYEGDTALEAYFRAMMWYGRANFPAIDEDLTRSAVLMTLALDEETLPAWESIYAVTSFFAGASDDSGYCEYKPAVEMAYGEGITADQLPGREEEFKKLMLIVGSMPAPKINAVPTPDDPGTKGENTELNKGFRFMGQRFSLDAAIFQNLVYDRVSPDASDNRRMLPDAMDVAAAFGSDTAVSILDGEGKTAYPNYADQLQLMRDAVESAPGEVWTASLYSRWLYTLKPLLDVKGEGYPMFMQSEAWTKKNLQSFLGSYTELKHDTVLYSKQVMVEMGGDLIEDKDDRGYVEPEPELFKRLGLLANTTKEGLEDYGLLTGEDSENLDLLILLAGYLEEIASKELRDELPTDEEFEIIRSFGGQIEHFWETVHREEADSEYFTSKEFPAAIVTDIASNSAGETLEVGTGNCGRIFCAVPVDGTVRLASGTVFSFYQFVQPSSERLTDTAWKQMMGIELDESGTYREPAIDPPEWVRAFQVKTEY